MNNSSNDVKKVIGVDALEIMFKGNIYLKEDYKINPKVKINENCYLMVHQSGNKNYNNIGDLFLDDRKIGEVRFSPRLGFFDSDLINFKIDNVQLYGNDYIDFINYLKIELGFEFLYISKIDIMVDCIQHDLIKFIRNYWKNTDPLTPQNKTYSITHKGKIKWDDIDARKITYWGNFEKSKYIKIYNKSLELVENSPDKKNYVEYFWKINGLNFKENIVERFELTLSTEKSKLIDYQQLRDVNYLASILRSHCTNYFDFEQSFKNHNKTYTKNITPIKFDDFKTIQIDKPKRTNKFTLRNEQMTLKSLYQEVMISKYIDTDYFVCLGVPEVPKKLRDYQPIENTIKVMLSKYPSLNELFENKFKNKWEKEFKKSNELLNGSVSIEDYIKSIDINNDILFTTPDFEMSAEENEHFKTLSTEEKKLIKLNTIHQHENKRTDQVKELKTIQNDSPILKKISNTVIKRINKIDAQNDIIRIINSNKNEGNPNYFGLLAQ